MRSSSRMRAPTKQSTQLVGSTQTRTHTHMTSCVRFALSQSLSQCCFFLLRFHSARAGLEKHLKIRWNAINSMNTVVSNAHSHWESWRTIRCLSSWLLFFCAKIANDTKTHTYIHQAVVVAAAAALPTQMIRYYSSENKHGEMIIKRNGANGAANRSALFSSCSVDGRRTTKFNKRLIGMRCGAGPCGIADKVRKKRNSFNSMFVAAFDRFRFISK